MLNNVPKGINLLTRNVVMNHPNTFNCEMYRKVVTRQAADTWADDPTMGGMGVLDTDDEEQYEYEFIGHGFALPAENFMPSPLVDKNDANIGYANEFRFLIEPAAKNSNEEGFFTVSTHDICYLLLYDGEHENPAKLAFEVVGRETTLNIPPFTTRYVCNRRDELDVTVNGELANPIED